MKKLSLFAGMLLLAPAVPGMAATATFQILASPFTSASLVVSGNGGVIAANSFGEIYRWTAAGGFQDLGPGDPYAGSIAISRDGSAINHGHHRRRRFRHAWSMDGRRMAGPRSPQ